MQALVANLELLARHDRNALKRICGVDNEDLADMIGEIRRLDPKPGLAFGSGVVHPLVPDVYVRPGADGTWIVELNSETLPRVLVNQSYHATVVKHAKSQEEKSFLADLPAERELAHPLAGPARPHHPEGGERDRAPAGRLPAARRALPAPAQPAHGGGRHRHARIHRLARDLEQIHLDPARRGGDEVLLLLRHSARAAARPIRRNRCATASRH